jgi:hypothetical protein
MPKIPKKLLNWPKWLTFALIFALFFIISLAKLDPDFGWHLRSGELFMSQGIPDQDPFTYTAPDFPWINHEPLNDILIYLLHSAAGYLLLALLFASLWTLAFFIITKKSKISPPLLFLAALAVTPYVGIRTLTWSFLFLSILISLADFPKISRPLKVGTALLLFALWANLHGSFLIGLIYIAYTNFYVFFTTPRKTRSLNFLPTLCAAFLATFLNPYGPRIYEEIFRTLFDSSLRWTISEWGINLPIPLIPYLLCFTFSVLPYLKSWRLRDYLKIDNCFLAAALLTQRHWPLFVLVSLPQTSKHLINYLTPLLKTAQKNLPLRRILTSSTIFLISISAYALYLVMPTSFDHTTNQPIAAINYLKEHSCTGRLFNEYNDGGYLIWQLPEEKLYIDGRMPSWEHNGENYMQNWLEIFKNPDFRAEQFKKYNITCALVFSSRTNFISDLKDNGWQIPVETESYILLFNPS